MSYPDQNKPAFPVPPGAQQTGVTLREWFAALALQGLVSKGLEVSGDRARTVEERDREFAERAFRLADAMLAERAKSGPTPAPAMTRPASLAPASSAAT